jgi:ADP-ribose pyrophosphatase YjhB (NUDIX family)
MNIPLAAAFRHCPRCGSPIASPGANPLVCGACGFQFFFGPVSAVGGIIADTSGQVLLLRRAKDPGKGLFGLPGGFIDAGETAEEALIREVREETSLAVTRTSYLCSFPNEYVYRGVIIPVTDLFFACKVASLDGLHAADGEISGFHICLPGVAELGRMAFESNRRALERYLAQPAG